jgi:hypothetical protein
MTVSPPFGNSDAYRALSVAEAQALLGLGYYAVTLPGVNFNSVVDTLVAIPLPAGSSTYLVDSVFIANASAPLTTAKVGLFTQPGGGGTAIIPGGTAVTVSSASANAANNAQQITPSTGPTQSFNAPILYFRPTTPAVPSPASATVVLFIRALF